MARSPAVPARVAWAVDLLDPRPDDVVLEVGGGPGVSASLVCARLTTGRLVEVERSPVAVARTRARAAGHVDAGRLVVVEGELASARLEPSSVDRALALDVGAFWTADPAAELDVLAGALRPGAPLLVLYGADSPTGPARVVPAVAAALGRHGFVGVRAVEAAEGWGVVARRAPAPLSERAGTLPA